jgi:hypothetical protein
MLMAKMAESEKRMKAKRIEGNRKPGENESVATQQQRKWLSHGGENKAAAWRAKWPSPAWRGSASAKMWLKMTKKTGVSAVVASESGKAAKMAKIWRKQLWQTENQQS